MPLFVSSKVYSPHKFYISSQCVDSGYHNTIRHTLMTHVSADENIIKNQEGCINLMKKSITDLDQRTDKQRFLELYNQAFSLPKKFDFQAHKGDEVCKIKRMATFALIGISSFVVNVLYILS